MKKLKILLFAGILSCLAISVGCKQSTGDSGNDLDNLVTKDPSDNPSGDSDNNSTEKIEIPVEVSAADRGIKFTAKVLSNITGGNSESHYASVTFKITEKESGISMVRNWKKSVNWITCDMYYPFVEKDKEYTFEFSADKDDYNLYKGEFTVKATGGLGEFKIENADAYKTELTAERIIKKSGKPQYTENPNVKILKQGLTFGLYANDYSSWVWGETLYVGDDYSYSYAQKAEKFTGEYELKKVSTWKNFEQIDNRLKGNNYFITSNTVITVAGYTDNGQTYFNMNDGSEIYGIWEQDSAKTKVYVIFGDSSAYNDLPGEPMAFSVTAGGEERTVTKNCMIVDYGQPVLEPANIPVYKEYPELKFAGWSKCNNIENNYFYYATFPLDVIPNKLSEDLVKITAGDKKVEYFILLEPNFSLNATVKGTVVQTGTEVEIKQMQINTYNNQNLTDNFDYREYNNDDYYDYHNFEGLYYDKDCTKRVYRDEPIDLKNYYTKGSNSLTLYTKEKVGSIKVTVKSWIEDKGEVTISTDETITDYEINSFYSGWNNKILNGYQCYGLYYDKNDWNNSSIWIYSLDSINLKNLERDADGTIILWTQATANSSENIPETEKKE